VVLNAAPRIPEVNGQYNPPGPGKDEARQGNKDHDGCRSVYVESATAHEVTLAMATLLHLVVPDPLLNLVAYNATTRIASTESWVLRH